MDWALVVQALGVVVWPAVVIGGLAIFRKPIEGLVGRIQTLELGAAKIHLERLIAASVQQKQLESGHATKVHSAEASVNADVHVAAAATVQTADEKAAALWARAVVDALLEVRAQGLALNPIYAPQKAEDLEFAHQAVEAGQLRWSPFDDGVMLPTT